MYAFMQPRKVMFLTKKIDEQEAKLNDAKKRNDQRMITSFSAQISIFIMSRLQLL